MTALPRWSDLVTARPDECDPIDDPRLRYDRFTARVLVVCALAMFLSGVLTGAGWVDYERAQARMEVLR
jgi:hypothetical protein